MAPIRETLRNTASRVVDVLKQKAYVHYQHGCLKLETNARVLKVCLYLQLSLRQHLTVRKAIH